MTMCFDPCHLSKTLLNATSSLKNLLIKSELIFSSLTHPLFCTSVIIISPLFYHFPCGSAGKEYACSAGYLDWIFPGLGRSPGEGKDYTRQYSGLENSMTYSPWLCKKLERLSDFHFHHKSGSYSSS